LILPALMGLACLVLWPGAAEAQDSDPYAALAAQDLRLAQIAERLVMANGHLCRAQMPVTGMILHTQDQYNDRDRPAFFATGRVALADVVPDSPAAAAGMQRGDVLLTIGETALKQLAMPEEGPLRDAVFELLAGQPATKPFMVGFARNGIVSAAQLSAPAGCLALFEITTENGLSARSDGRVIQIAYPLAVLASDEQLAVIFAHELAHSVLEHRARLQAAGVRKGFFGEFGRNRQHNRQVEIEADRMLVHLLANAGYDPRIGPAFFRSAQGRRVTGGLLSFVYPKPSSRAEAIEQEINRFLPSFAGPSWPEHLLALRDQPFSKE